MSGKLILTQVRLWACGHGGVSTPSFGSHLNPISTMGSDYAHPILVSTPSFESHRIRLGFEESTIGCDKNSNSNSSKFWPHWNWKKFWYFEPLWKTSLLFPSTINEIVLQQHFVKVVKSLKVSLELSTLISGFMSRTSDNIRISWPNLAKSNYVLSPKVSK